LRRFVARYANVPELPGASNYSMVAYEHAALRASLLLYDVIERFKVTAPASRLRDRHRPVIMAAPNRTVRTRRDTPATGHWRSAPSARSTAPHTAPSALRTGPTIATATLPAGTAGSRRPSPIASTPPPSTIRSADQSSLGANAFVRVPRGT